MMAHPLRLSRFEVFSAGFSQAVIPVLKQFLTGDAAGKETNVAPAHTGPLRTYSLGT